MEAQETHTFLYVESTIPAGLTIAEYRRLRTASAPRRRAASAPRRRLREILSGSLGGSAAAFARPSLA